MKKRTILTILAAGTLAFAAFGAFAAHAVNAQAPTPTPSDQAPSPDEEGSKQTLPSRRMGLKDQWGGYVEEDLASALGITVEELEAAEAAAMDQALEQAVSQGLITQEQADRIKANTGGDLRFGLRGMKNGAIDMQALLAEALGISVDELEDAQTEAFNATVDRALEEGTITQERADLLKGRRALATDDTFQSSMRSAFEAAVAQAVESGVITQAQADLILQNSQQRFFPGWGGFDGMHGRGGRGRHGWPGGAAPSDPTTPATPSPEAPASSNGA